MTIERNVAGLWCHEVAELLEGYVAARLDDRARAQVEGHVAECEHCASFGARYAALIDRVKAIAEAADGATEDDEIAARVRARLAALE